MPHPLIAVAGHICLDIIPTFLSKPNSIHDLLIPGTLTKVGPVVISTGGAVSNTGLALHRLGVPVKLLGKIGNDPFGEAILAVLRRHDSALADGMIISPTESTSYTIVINPPGIDRIFLHDPGPNDTFSAADVKLTDLAGVRSFHFGYPPLMRRMALDGGAELVTLMAAVKALGITTSLDMTLPDPNSDVGEIDWSALIRAVLPQVDIFAPSIDELLFMLDRTRFDTRFDTNRGVDGDLLHSLSSKLLAWGAAIVLIKLGEQGAYLRTTANLARLQAMGSGAPADLADWQGREIYVPAFQVDVRGTTGAGDCTIAGLLTGVLYGLGCQAALTAAVAVGACSVESADATSGVPKWEAVRKRVDGGWLQYSQAIEIGRLRD